MRVCGRTKKARFSRHKEKSIRRGNQFATSRALPIHTSLSEGGVLEGSGKGRRRLHTHTHIYFPYIRRRKKRVGGWTCMRRCIARGCAARERHIRTEGMEPSACGSGPVGLRDSQMAQLHAREKSAFVARGGPAVELGAAQ